MLRNTLCIKDEKREHAKRLHQGDTVLIAKGLIRPAGFLFVSERRDKMSEHKKGANGNDCKGDVISAELDDIGVGVGVVQVQVTVAVFPPFPA